jgi:hypothetical protein
MPLNMLRRCSQGENLTIKKLYLNAGQMKAGTTFLYGILYHHPKIYFSQEKELHFLSQNYGEFLPLSDENRIKKVQTILRGTQFDADIPQSHRGKAQWVANYLDQPDNLEWYKNVFSGIEDGQYAADFSNLTCTIPKRGLMEIRKNFPGTKITYCVREPVSRAYSHLNFHLSYSGEEKALCAFSNRDLKKLLRSKNILPQSQVKKHLENLVSVFGEDNVGIINCEKLWEGTQKSIDSICQFLDIERLKVKEHHMKPVNASPKRESIQKFDSAIRKYLAKEIKDTENTLNKFESIILNSHI